MNKYFEILSNFFGQGEPKNSIWFIGIEEHQTWSANPQDDTDMYEKYKKRFLCCEKGEIRDQARKIGRGYTRVYEIISKIAVGVKKESKQNIIGWKDYRDNFLFQKGTDTFQANLFPLGKEGEKAWPPHYNELFGFGKGDFGKYIKFVKEKRFPMLRNFWEDSNPQATICFGKNNYTGKKWEDFKELLKIMDDKPDIKSDSIMFYKNRRIILTPFFGYGHMDNENIDTVILLLKGILEEQVK